MRTLRTLFGILGVVALVTFAYSGGGAAAEDSMSDKCPPQHLRWLAEPP